MQRKSIRDEDERAAIQNAIGFKAANTLHCGTLDHVSTATAFVVLNDVSRAQYICAVPKHPIRYLHSFEAVLTAIQHQFDAPFTTLLFTYHLEQDGVHLDTLQATEVPVQFDACA